MLKFVGNDVTGRMVLLVTCSSCS